MNTEDQNQDFEKLKQLLKLKRYETPPPRYFNDFSGQVVSRIRGGKSGERYEAFENLVTNTPWLRRLWQKLESQPALSGAVAAIACGLMVAGVFLMEKTTPPDMNFMAVGETPEAGNASTDFASLPVANSFASASTLGGSTNSSSLLTGPNLFDHIVPGIPGQPMLPPAQAAGLPVWQRSLTNPATPLFR